MSILPRLMTAALIALSLATPLMPTTASACLHRDNGYCTDPAPPPSPGGPTQPSGPNNNKPYPEEPDPYGPPPGPKPLLVACRTDSGEPDLKFRNIGEVLIPKGSKVTWAVKESGEHGVFVLPSDLSPGQALSEADVLRLGLPAYDHCFSKVA